MALKNGKQIKVELPSPTNPDVLLSYDLGQDVVPGPLPGMYMTLTWIKDAAGNKTYLDPDGNSVTYLQEVVEGTGIYFFETFFQGQVFTGYMFWNAAGHWDAEVSQNGNKYKYVPE